MADSGLRAAAVARAKDIVRADEWKGDIRVNMTTVIGAGRVLAKRLEEMEAERDELVAALKAVNEWYDRDGSVGGLVDPMDVVKAILAKVEAEQ